MPGYVRVEVFVGRDGLGYFVPVYGNNKRGPRSEGYGHTGQPPATAVRLAERYARRDHPGLAVVEVERPAR